MRGSTILLDVPGKGKHFEGYIGTGLTVYPGIVVQLQGATALREGRHTWELYAPGSDGVRLPVVVVLDQPLQGRLYSVAYTAGEIAKLYVPAAGDELNMLLQNQSGTGDHYSAGEVFIVDNGTGKLIVTASTPESEPFMLMEAVAAMSADTWAWCMYTGY